LNFSLIFIYINLSVILYLSFASLRNLGKRTNLTGSIIFVFSQRLHFNYLLISTRFATAF